MRGGLRLTRSGFTAACMALCGVCLSNTPSAAPGLERRQLQPAVRPGSTSTLLPDGTRLIAGGLSGGTPVSDVFLQDAAGTLTTLPDGLRRPRAGHTATVLADGRVLVVGGRGDDGALELTVEVFDVDDRQFMVVSTSIPPRSDHTATLLTDGRVLFAGGRGQDGEPLETVLLWNPDDDSTKSVLLVGTKTGHQAILQPDGTVLLKASDGLAELFVPGPDVIVVAGADPLPSPVHLAGSAPEDGATGVDVHVRIALRFSGPLSALSIGEHALTLSGPQGVIPTAITVAEEARLVFLSPRAALTPGETYLLVAHGLRAHDETQVGPASLSFTTSLTTASADRPLMPPPADDVWRPEGPGRWRTGAARSPWQDLPPLMAPDGVTAVAGQVLRLNGTPLAGVELEIEGRHAESDRTGRFLLALDSLPAGRHVLEIDGAAASHQGRTYGFFEAGVQVLAHQTAALPFTIWMPALDMAHAVTIPSPTTQETVVTTPLIPGLELHLPPRTVIKDEHGHRVTQLSITPIPVDRPPFPLPAGVEVPIYFTIQPGGAYVATYGSGPKGARLYYPN